MGPVTSKASCQARCMSPQWPYFNAYAELTADQVPSPSGRGRRVRVSPPLPETRRRAAEPFSGNLAAAPSLTPARPPCGPSGASPRPGRCPSHGARSGGLRRRVGSSRPPAPQDSPGETMPLSAFWWCCLALACSRKVKSPKSGLLNRIGCPSEFCGGVSARRFRSW